MFFYIHPLLKIFIFPPSIFYYIFKCLNNWITVAMSLSFSPPPLSTSTRSRLCIDSICLSPISSHCWILSLPLIQLSPHNPPGDRGVKSNLSGEGHFVVCVVLWKHHRMIRIFPLTYIWACAQFASVIQAEGASITWKGYVMGIRWCLNKAG